MSDSERVANKDEVEYHKNTIENVCSKIYKIQRIIF